MRRFHSACPSAIVVNRVKALLNGEQAPDDRQAFVALITRLVALPNQLLPDS
jgi:hypothetical protein